MVGHAYLPVAPQLVALHAVAVVQSERAVVGDGVKADFLGVHGVAHPDVFSPAEGEDLRRERRRVQKLAARFCSQSERQQPARSRQAHLPMFPAHLAPPLQAALHPNRTSGEKVLVLQTHAAADVTDLRDQIFSISDTSALSSVGKHPGAGRTSPQAAAGGSTGG